MARQWLRRVSLKLGDRDGKALDVSDLRFTFAIRQNDVQSPNTCDITVYNVSAETARRAKEEFLRVVLEAGYEGSYGAIFDGTIIQARHGRESGTDTYLNILGQEGDAAYNFAVANKTLAAGHTLNDVEKALCDAQKPHGVERGYVPDLGGPTYPRGRVVVGMVRDGYRELGAATGATWSIAGTKSQVLKTNEYLPGEAVVLNSRTGMIGFPAQTPDGIIVRCLLNPRIKPGVKLKIDNASIQDYKMATTYTGEKDAALVPKKDADGEYRVVAVDHFGDTRGQEFYTEVVATGRFGAVSTSQAQRGRSGEAAGGGS